MDYDVLILGGGIIGCSVAYELSKFSLNIALIEKEYDIADEVAIVNSAVIYDGVESNDTLMSKLEIIGNQMFDEITSKFNVPFKRNGSYFIAQNEKQEKILQQFYDMAVSRGINGIELIEGNHIYEIEPNLNFPVRKALYSKNTGVICPYDLAIAYGEVAFDNGVNFKLEEEVIDIQKISRGYRIVTNKNKFTCKTVINTTPGIKLNLDSDNKEKEQTQGSGHLGHLLLKKKFTGNLSNLILTFNNDDEVMSSIPTVQGNTLVSVESKEIIDFQRMRNFASAVVSGIESKDIKGFYQEQLNRESIIIDDSLIDKGYIKVSGKHYAEVTMTPSIAKMVCETIVSHLNAKEKKEFIDKRREVYKFKYLSNEERNNIIKMNKSYGKIICLCQYITEGEIVDSIRRPLGARTVEGVKRRTGATFGDCQGSYCFDRIVSILARETNKSITDIVKSSKNSKIVMGRIKEFDEV